MLGLPLASLLQLLTTLEPSPKLVYGTSELALKALLSETLGMAAAGIGLELVFVGFEQVDCFPQGFWCLVIEEYSGGLRSGPSDNGFQSPALTIGDHWTPCSLGLDGSDAKIFIRSEDKGLGPLQMIRYHLVRLVA
jgi:hypothetical protein